MCVTGHQIIALFSSDSKNITLKGVIIACVKIKDLNVLKLLAHQLR